MPNDKRIHPYIPNSAPSVQAAMLQELGIQSIDDLYAAIPSQLRFSGKMDVPGPLDEWSLRRHVDSVLNSNVSSNESLSFLGGGCWPHFIPAICDEIAGRAEFLTAYAGEPYEDHGRFQALFEYQSLVAELVDMDVVNVPTFDWAQATATSLRMAARITGRNKVLIPRNLSPDKRQIVENYCVPVIHCIEVPYDKTSGTIDLHELKHLLNTEIAAVYFETPSYFGVLETEGKQISALAHAVGALCVVGVDPLSLGVLEAPVHYGADIVCGELQPLGIHMNFGGGLAGFIATADNPKFVMEFPSRLFGITATSTPEEYGFGDVAYERTSFAQREKGKESVGTQTALWGITAGVYLSLLGPHGLVELNETILQKSLYARQRLNAIPGVNAYRFKTVGFKEFVVDFSGTGITVGEITEQLREMGIFGGVPLGEDFPELDQALLICVTEVHTQADIDSLVEAVESIVTQKTGFGEEGKV